jgi:hypothetical protein
MENINQAAQPVNQPVAQPQQQEPQAPSAIPYDRFASVIAERNSLRDQLNQVAGQIAQAQPQPSNSVGGINTVEDLLSVVEQKVSARLGDAERTRLAPLENQLKDYRFQNTVEGYFASSPEKAQLRQDMDAYTASLTPQEQAFLKDSVANGRTQWLDNIYHSVAQQKQSSLVNQATKQSHQNAGIAQTPTQYRTFGQVEPTLGDKINQAKQTRDWSSVFKSMVPPPRG